MATNDSMIIGWHQGREVEVVLSSDRTPDGQRCEIRYIDTNETGSVLAHRISGAGRVARR